MKTENQMLMILVLVLLYLVGRIWHRRGIDAYEIVMLANVAYFTFSGYYQLLFPSNNSITYSDSVIKAAYAGVLLYITGLYLSKSLYRSQFYLFNLKEPASSAFHTFQRYHNSINSTSIKLLFAIGIYINYLYYFIGGRIIYGSTFTEHDDPLTYEQSLLVFSWNIINVGLFSYALINVIYKKQGSKIIQWIIIIVTLVLSTLSRRDFTSYVIIIILIYLSTVRKTNLKSFIIILCLTLTTITLILPFIYSFRNQIAYKDPGDISLELESFFSSNQDDDLRELNYSENLATRGYIISSNLELIETQKRLKTPFLNGEILLSSIIFITPYFLYPQKRDYEPPDALIQSHNSLPEYDHSENIPYVAMAEFGLLGALIFGLFIGLLLNLLQDYCIKGLNNYPLTSLSSLIYLIIFCLKFEGLPHLYLILCRDIGLIYFASWVIELFTRHTAPKFTLVKSI